MKGPVAFIRAVKEEARKTSWPSKKEVVMTALFVFIFTSIMAIFFLGIDSIFVKLISWLMGL